MVTYIKVCNLIGISCVLVVCLYVNISAGSKETESQKIETAVKKLGHDDDDELKVIQKRAARRVVRHRKTHSEQPTYTHNVKHTKKHSEQPTKKRKEGHTKKHDVPQNVTTAGTSTKDSNDTEESIYANKKTDVNQKAVIIGEENGPKAKPKKVDPTEVADDDLKTGVIITIIVVVIAFVGCGAVMWGRREQIKGILSGVKEKMKKDKGDD
ncbi:uncharacterized protein LOC134270468 [Saccostrea cucullata]|uniref:uncharacterized protein LOC134270468 n=1 Tax=Saccostrea cuccullata TaxID=36930 RepID=UPI002ED64BAD